MASLTFREKSKLEELLEMKSGYVLDFSNSSFEHFIEDVCNINIYTGEGYEDYASKANKLRQIWNNENDLIVGKLLNALLDECLDYKQRTNKYHPNDERNVEKMKLVANRLLENVIKLDVSVQREDTLKTLQEDINYALARNQPTLVLDRLHTFSTKFLRQICMKYSITVVDSKGINLPLHSLAGMLKKYYEQNPVFDSEFVPMAIQTSIMLFDRFNAIRNNQSYAHDNIVLSNVEAEFVVRTMINTISFIETIERYRISNSTVPSLEDTTTENDDLLF